MADDTADRVKCPSCAEQISAEARVCPLCRQPVVVDVVLDRALQDPRLRYRVARALVEMGSPLPGIAEAQRRLSAPVPVVAERLTMFEARRVLDVLGPLGVQARTRAHDDSAFVGSGSREPVRPRANVSRGRDSSIWTWAAGALLVVAVAATLFWTFRRPTGEAARLSPGSGAVSQRSPLSTEELAERVLPSTVAVHCGNGVGAGFFVADHLVLTNAHVVDLGCAEATIHLSDGRETAGPVVQRLKNVDLALVEINEVAGRPLPLGDAAAMRVGERILFVGSPRQLEFTVHEGLISSVSRTNMGTAYLQLDAKINPGNSGGPVINALGEVVGVVTLKLEQAEGIGFALPINYVFADQGALISRPPNVDVARFAAMVERASAEEQQVTTSIEESWEQPALVQAEPRWHHTQYGSEVEYVLTVARLSPTPPARTTYYLNISVGNVPTCSLTVEVAEWQTIEGATASALTDRKTAEWLRRKNLDAQIYAGEIVVPRPPCPGQPDDQISVVELVGADPAFSRARLR